MIDRRLRCSAASAEAGVADGFLSDGLAPCPTVFDHRLRCSAASAEAGVVDGSLSDGLATIGYDAV